MAYYARIDNNNVVTYITSISDEKITDENGVEHEHWALSYLYESIPDSKKDRWIRTSTDNNLRKRFASIGSTYNQELDAFIPPKPFDSWSLNTETVSWNSPIPYPTDGKKYTWNEDEQKWDLLIVGE